MDVFSSDGVFQGSVVYVSKRSAASISEPSTSATPADGPSFSGESLGPMPTAALGNRGPAHQRDAGGYATADAAHPPVSEPAELLVFRTRVALNWGILWPRLRRYPVSLVLHVSHERIVLAATATELEEK